MIYCLALNEGRIVVVNALDAMSPAFIPFESVEPFEANSWKEALIHFRPIAESLHAS